MPLSQQRFVHLFREIGLVVTGLILAFVPLALWVAWSATIYYVVLSVCALAALCFVLLTRINTRSEEEPPPANRDLRRTLSKEWIAELQSLQPLTYHHRRLGDARLWNKFRRLRELMRHPDD